MRNRDRTILHFKAIDDNIQVRVSKKLYIRNEARLVKKKNEARTRVRVRVRYDTGTRIREFFKI
jgi:hypothetical protein